MKIVTYWHILVRKQMCACRQTHPEGLCNCLFSLLHSAPSSNFFFPWWNSSVSPFCCCPSRAAAAAAERSPCSLLLQKCVRQSGSMKQRPVACSARMNGSPEAQTLGMMCEQLLEEEKVQQPYLNGGSINQLTHLPKWLEASPPFCLLRAGRVKLIKTN